VNITVPVVLTGVGALESVAFTVRVTGPATVVVPLMVQLVAVRPVGRVPARIWQVYGAVPPATPMSPLYGTLTVALGGLLSVRVALAGFTVKLTGPVTVFEGALESVAFTVRVTGPATLVMPLMVQLVSTKPAGSVPARIWQT
jgi:hypothetical protein